MMGMIWNDGLLLEGVFALMWVALAGRRSLRDNRHSGGRGKPGLRHSGESRNLEGRWGDPFHLFQSWAS